MAATSSHTETTVPAIASVNSSVAVTQPAYLVSESQPTTLRSLSAQVARSQSTVTAAASVTTLPGTPLTLNDFKPAVSGATARWVGTGLNAAPLQKPTQVPFVIGDLPGSSLGEAAENHVYLGTNTAGSGGLVDSTPASSEAFTPSPNKRQLPAVDPRLVDQMDLGTVAEHELGHTAGLTDLDALTDDIMGGVLGAGVRRNVCHVDAVLAS